MSALPANGTLAIAGHRLEYRSVGPAPGTAPTIVLLHEGLGCAELWGDFPEALSAATACGVFAYSRAGYGWSSTVPLPRPLTYMHDEARDILPRVLDAIGLRRCLLVGHSDGASIAAIYAGSRQDHRIIGLTLIAPHFFVEEVTIRAITDARTAYATTDLRSKLARWHADADVAFRGWCNAWLDPAFSRWDIRDALPYIRVPVQVIQGTNDPYGTIAQVEAVEHACMCPVETALLPAAKHSPHREARAETVALIAGFIAHLRGL